MVNNIDAILEGLNSEQRNAVCCVEGPVLIVAGAGSGKTRVLTCRIANLLALGCPAERIMALTFTKKAAGEMKERIALMVGREKARRLCMGTFHSVFARFLRDWAPQLGYPRDFTIYDQSDSTSAIKACIKELELDDKVYKPREVLSRISSAKNNLVTADRYRMNPKAVANDTQSRRPRICDIYSLYERKCRQNGVMDFDDILLNMNILFRDHPDALDSVASGFSHILVDEYQDTNYAQYLVIRKLSQNHHNICVVGDDSQSIYAFRGARIENILNFRKDYPECRTFRLERNYRSTRTIVGAANSVIERNANRIPKQCYSEGAEGEKIHLMRAYTEQEEAVLVVGELLSRMRKEQASYRDFAILYRTNAQSRAIEEAMRRRNVPYLIYSGNSFFERAEVKDMMAYFKLVVNPMDDESFKRAVNRPARGIGATSLDALEAAARSKGLPLFRTAFQDDLGQFGLKDSGISKIREFCLMLDGFALRAKTEAADVIARGIADRSGLYQFFKTDMSIEGQARLANVEELLNSVTQFIEDRQEELLAQMAEPDADALPVVTMCDYLENVSLLSNVDIDGSDEEDATNKVSLMTVHSAKGLEYPFIFVVGMEENLFPSGGMLASPSDIEEERRLFYVALTRAGKTLTLSYAESRMRNGKHESNPVSRFVKEIDSRFLDNPITEEETEDESAGWGGFGGFGSRFSRRGGASGSLSNYGTSSKVQFEPRRRPSAPQPVMTSRPLVSRTPAPASEDRDFASDPLTSFQVGQRIEHNRFGYGTILDISGEFPSLKATISFDGYGEKFIMLNHAKIRIRK